MIIFSCNSNVENITSEDTNTEIDNHSDTVDDFWYALSSLQCEVLMYGDSNNYILLRKDFFDTNLMNSLSKTYAEVHRYEFYHYSYVMAHRYDFSLAYYDIYDQLTNCFYSDISEIDSLSASLAIWHLLEAAKRGDSLAIREVEKYSITEEDIFDAKPVLLEIHE